MKHDEDPYLEELRVRIRNCEERFISYKKMLEGVHRDKDIFPPGEPWVIEHKDSLRWAKNMEQQHLAELIEEKTYYPGSTPSQDRRFVEAMAKRSRFNDLHTALERSLKNEDIKALHPAIAQLLTDLKPLKE